MADALHWDWRAGNGDAAHGTFVLSARGRQWIGRKPDPCRNDSAALFNVVRPVHLLGPGATLHDKADGGKHVTADRCSLEVARDFMASAATDPDAEVVFPWASRHASGNAFVCPPSFWSSASNRADVLALGEQHMRPLCERTLKTLPDGALVRDPACSTGDFIAAMASACPTLSFEGSDKHPDMIRIATERHAGSGVAFTCLDATDAASMPCDGLILRFLNEEVMQRADAIALFDALAASVRPGGRIMVFGHTPVLVPVHERAAALGLRVMRSVAPVQDGLVQYYVLQRLP